MKKKNILFIALVLILGSAVSGCYVERDYRPYHREHYQHEYHHHDHDYRY
jgi:hypothetical protein